MIRITLTILVHFSIGQMIPSFYRQLLDFSATEDSVLNAEISGWQKANIRDTSLPSSGGILEILKQRQQKRELIAMVDDMAHGPGFHNRRHSTDEYRQKTSFKIAKRRNRGKRFQLFVNHHRH